MLLVLSPSKTLDDETPLPAAAFTQPALLKEAGPLVLALKKYSAPKLGKLMGISEKLAALNAQRYKDFRTPFTPANARPALYAFKGDVYAGFALENYGPKELAFAQAHMRTLSGLYGLLRPLDLMQPYRLEMGTRLATARAKDLYGYWGDKITREINHALAESGSSLLINLASEEYFAAVRPQALEGSIVHIQFKEKKGDKLQTIGLFAKKARGRMADWVIRHRVTAAQALQGFEEGGYRYRPGLSDASHFVFVR